MSELDLFSKLPEHSQLDCGVVAISSHGVEGAVYGSDGKLVQVRQRDKYTERNNLENIPAITPLISSSPLILFVLLL